MHSDQDLMVIVLNGEDIETLTQIFTIVPLIGDIQNMMLKVQQQLV